MKLPARRRNMVFQWLSRTAGLMALVFIFLGALSDMADRDLGLESGTWMFLGLYILGVQIYFMIEYFVETGGGIEEE